MTTLTPLQRNERGATSSDLTVEQFVLDCNKAQPKTTHLAQTAMSAASDAAVYLSLGDATDLDWEDYDGGAVAGIHIAEESVAVPEDDGLLETPNGLIHWIPMFDSLVLFVWIPMEGASLYKMAFQSEDCETMSAMNYAASLLVQRSNSTRWRFVLKQD